MAKLWIIARTTFSEIIRQPFFFVIIAIAGALIAASPTFTAFTLLNNLKLMKEMGLATMLLAAWFLSAVAAARVVSDEIQTRTVMTLLAKPVSRAHFVIGKFLGIVAAVGLACAIMGAVLMIIARVGVKEAAYTRLDIPLLWTLVGVMVGSIVLGALFNYLFNLTFTATAIKLMVVLLWLTVLVFAFLDKTGKPVSMVTSLDTAFLLCLAAVAVVSGLLGLAAWQMKYSVVATVALSFVSMLNVLMVVFLVLHTRAVGRVVAEGMPEGVFLFRYFDPQLLQAVVIGAFGAFVLAAVALMCSTRLSLVSTAVMSLLIYSLGLVSDNLLELLKMPADTAFNRAVNEVVKRVYYIVPNFQHFRVGDVLMQADPEIAGHFVPAAYLGWTAAYAATLMAMFLLLAMALFQQREVS